MNERGRRKKQGRPYLWGRPFCIGKAETVLPLYESGFVCYDRVSKVNQRRRDWPEKAVQWLRLQEKRRCA